jgi:hypothetical protein
MTGLCGESDGEQDEDENNTDEDYLNSEPSEPEEELLDEEHWDRGHKGACSLITALTTEKTKTTTVTVTNSMVAVRSVRIRRDRDSKVARIAGMYEAHDGEHQCQLYTESASFITPCTHTSLQ